MSGIVYEIYDDKTNRPLFYKKQIANTISDVVTGAIAEVNGWKRVRMPKSEWDVHFNQGLKDLASLKKFWTS